MVRESDILAISTDCAQLTSLAIRCRHVESTFAPMWRSLKSNLSPIYISGNYWALRQNAISVYNLLYHCVNLSRIDEERVDEETVVIMATIGNRIRVVLIENTFIDSPHKVHVLYEACAN